MSYLEFEYCPKCGKKSLEIDITSPFFRCTTCKHTFKIDDNTEPEDLLSTSLEETDEEHALWNEAKEGKNNAKQTK